jgi:hypothetical protein
MLLGIDCFGREGAVASMSFGKKLKRGHYVGVYDDDAD